MDRLKALGKWVVLVIAFYIFSNILIKINLNNMKAENRYKNQTQITQDEKKY